MSVMYAWCTCSICVRLNTIYLLIKENFQKSIYTHAHNK
jgi:hypothetical protein